MPAPRLTHEVLIAILAWLTGLSFSEKAFAFDGEEAEAADRAYRSAVSFLHRNLNDLAIEEYQKFLKVADADHEHLTDALYGLAIASSREQDLDTAIASLEKMKKATKYPRAVEARVLLGQCLMKNKQYADAAKALSSASQLTKSHPLLDAGAALEVEAHYLAGDFAEAARTGGAFAKQFSDSKHQSRVFYFVADASLRLEKTDDAISAAKRVLATADNGPLANPAQLVLARAYRLRGDLRQAANAYDALAARDIGPLREDVLYELAQVFTAQDEFGKAAEVLDALLKDLPKTTFRESALLHRAQLALRLEDVATAERLAKSISKSDSKLSSDANYILAQAYLNKREFRKALRKLSELVETKAEPRAAIQYDLAVCQYNLERPQETLDTLANFETLDNHESLGADALLLRLRAATAIKNDEIAIACGKQFLKQYPEHPQRHVVRVMLAEQAARADDHRSAVELLSDNDFTAARNIDKELASQAQLRRALSLIAIDRAQEAEPLLHEISKRHASTAISAVAEKTLGGILADRGDWKAAAKWWRSVFEQAADENERRAAALQLGICELRQENYQAALSALEFVTNERKADTTYEVAMFEQGQALLALKRLHDAGACFNKILRDSKDRTLIDPARRHLAYIAQAQGNVTLAAQHLEDLADKSGDGKDAADGAFLRAAALLAANEDERALAAFDAFAKKFKEDPRRVEAQARGIIAASRLGRCEDVLKRFEKLDEAEVSSKALREAVLYARASCLLKLTRVSEARDALVKLEESNPSPELRRSALVELASIEINEGKYQEAEARLKAVREIEIENAGKVDALRSTLDYYDGICAFHRGDFAKSAESLERYFAANQSDGQNNPGAHLYAGESLFKLGRFHDALVHLKLASAKDADPAQLRAALLRLGETHAQLQQWPDSESTFARYLEHFGDKKSDEQARFGLAWAQENMSRYPEAIENYRVVADRSKTELAARAQFQIGECCFALKDYELALRELMKVDILYAYPQWSAAALYEAARCLESLGRDTDARRQFTEISDKYPESRWAGLSRERLRLNKPQLPGRGGAGE